MPTTSTRQAFRPRSRSRVRLLAGVALVAAAVVINVAVYRRLDERVAVLQLTRDVPAGQILVDDDLREVQASTSSDINVVVAGSRQSFVGQTAKVRLIAGSLLVGQAVQQAALVAPGSSILALVLPNGELPAGLRERSNVLLVLLSDASSADSSSTVAARVATLPQPAAGQSDRLTMSVEMSAADAPRVAAADHVRVILLDPSNDSAYAPISATTPIAGTPPTPTTASVPG